MKKKKLLNAIALSAIFVGSGFAVNAATINSLTVVSASGGQFDQDSSNFTGESLYETATVSASSAKTAVSGGAEAGGFTEVDARTGELRFALSGTQDANECNTAGFCDANYYASTHNSLREDIFVSGTGTLSVFMQVDAFWNSPRWNFAASAQVFAGGNSDNDVINLSSLENPNIDSVDSLLTASIDFSGVLNESVGLRWVLQGDISPPSFNENPSPFESGFMDASNTGTIFFTASDDLTVSGLTSGFLSNPAFGQTSMAAVPLPAGGMLLLSGLVGMTALKRRSNRIA